MHTVANKESEIASRVDPQELQSALASVAQIDLSRETKIVGEKHALSEEDSKELCLRYRQWLALKKCLPEAELVPSKDIDDFWHEHILDTRKYVRDCEDLFGRFLHHEPCDDLGDEALKEHEAAFLNTRSIYRHVFGEQLNSSISGCG